MGSLVWDELGCLGRWPTLAEWTIPGEQEDSDVGVDVRLHIPGDPEYLVDGLLAVGMLGVGGGKFCVLTVRRLASSLGP